ncbi:MULTISPECIES: hypothetical protein [unclassified Luteibacter]|uniref:hypothetical protein n=1 Tax=Luteibacter sp. PvP019 TaxID=3156436 RepID=UPI003395DB5B
MSPRLARWLGSPLVLPVLLVLGAMLSVSRGQDAAWDLKNYHIYNAWAFLHHRLTIDIAAAGLQSYFNPLPDVPYYWLGSGVLDHSPRLLAAFQGLWYGALVFVLLRIVLRHEASQGRAPGWMALIALTIGATGSMTWSQAGLSTNEVPLALLVLSGYLLAMPLPGSGNVDWKRAAFAGLLCGLAAGLKPTAIVYAPALAFAVWAASGFARRALGLAVLLGLASVIGFAITYGAWGLALARLTGNPIFPMFNQVFHSPWMPAESGTDKQFMPHSIVQAIFYPFWWLRNNTTQGGNSFADWRYALAMLAMLAYGLVAMRSRGNPRNPGNTLLITFVGVGYVLWLGLYSILRYAIPIEALSGLVMVTAVRACMDAFPTLRASRWPTGVAVALLVLILGTTRYTDWGHAPFGKTSFDIDVPTIPAGSLVILASQPHAYLAAFTSRADTTRFVGVTWLNAKASGFELDQRAKLAIVEHQGPRYVITRDSAEGDMALLRTYLPTMTVDACQQIRSQIEQTRRRRDLSDGLRICRISSLETGKSQAAPGSE